MLDSGNQSVVQDTAAQSRRGQLTCRWRGWLSGAIASLSGCATEQSALAPAGREAHQIAQLFWWMLGVGTVIWLVMMGLAFYALVLRREPHSERQTRLFVIVGGAVVPTVILTILLCFGLSMLPKLVAPAPAGSLVVRVQAAQWWWRVQYQAAGGESLELANEFCIPVDEAVEFRLESEDVIHSFWIPSLGGKVDMIPGRTTRLVLHPTRTGIYRGACAEYCGSSHALMNFYVRVVTRAEFDDWLKQQARDAAIPTEPDSLSGREIFLSSGCGACHALRGTSARGAVGPDLTHFGSRHSLGAGLLENNAQSIVRWLKLTEHLKPDVEMPAFHFLGEERLRDLAAYLEQLK